MLCGKKTINWLLFTLIAMLLWGFGGFFSEMATSFIHDVDVAIYQVVGSILVAGIAAFFIRFQPNGKLIGILFTIFSGISAALATFFFFSAITCGRSVVVVSMTAFYPLVTLAS